MFITFEGIDGSGKSTQISLLEAWLRSSGKEVLSVREPGGSPLSESVRSVLLSIKHNIHPLAELLLFEAARAQLVETVIKPAINNEVVVLCDRFADSTIAYQSFGRGLPANEVVSCNTIATGGLKPDITFFLDLPIEVAFQRAGRRGDGAPDRMEQAGKEFFERVRQGYFQIARDEPNRFKIISGDSNVEDIQDSIRMIVSVLLKKLQIAGAPA